MARPKIGLFGALFAVGSVLAWKWAQARRDTATRAPRDLNRWEDEGGKIVTPASASASVDARPASAASNGNGVVGGTPDAWHFPHS
ncbi:hypothetical protein [Caballeronia sp. DA-9]|uniref:hypothetical protein n=1 Tax=Caballeronia sp. DA-9 TaxID=3436237 RepID=UPI003F67DB21